MAAPKVDTGVINIKRIPQPKLDDDNAQSGDAKEIEKAEQSDIEKCKNEDHFDVAQWFLVETPDVDTDVALLKLAADEGEHRS